MDSTEELQPPGGTLPGKIDTTVKKDGEKKKPAAPEEFASLEGAGAALSQPLKKIAVVLNPFSGRRRGGKVFQDIKGLFEGAGIELATHETHGHWHAAHIVRDLDCTGVDALMLIGGDGTYCESLCGYFRRPENDRPPIALIPAGTGNSVLTSMGQRDPIVAAKQVLRGVQRSIDVGKVTYGAKNNVVFSINLLGFGLAVDCNLRAERLRWLGELRYNAGIVWEILRFPKHHVKLDIDGHKREGDCSLLLVQNNQHGGTGLRIAPYAKLDDGCLDLILQFNPGSRGKIMDIFNRIKDNGRHIYYPGMEYRRFRRLSIESTGNDCYINVDGNNFGSPTDPALPCVMEVQQGVLPILN